MRRVLLIICLLLAAASGLGWIAGLWWGKIVLFERGLGGGRKVWACVETDTLVVTCDHTYQLRLNERPPLDRTINLLWFKWSRGCSVVTWFSGENLPGWTGEYPTVSTQVEVPFWSPMLVFGIWPAIALWRGPIRRRRRQARSACLTCGYDLTGNTSGVCPEYRHQASSVAVAA